MSDEFPVDKIVGAQDGCSWGIVHGGCGHVVSVVNTNYVNVREIFPERRIIENLSEDSGSQKGYEAGEELHDWIVLDTSVGCSDWHGSYYFIYSATNVISLV